MLRNLTLLGSSLLVSFVFLEVAVRLFAETRSHAATAIADVDLENPISFLPGRSRAYETGELHFTLATNRFGRRDAEWGTSTLADPANILFIGDSLVVGFGVETESTIPTLLEERFAASGAPLEVFNFGMPAAGPAEYVQLFDEAVRLGIEARTVLVGIFVGNDFYATPPPPPGSQQAPQKFGNLWLPHSQLVSFLKTRVSQSARLVGWALTVGRWLGISIYDTGGSYVFLREQTPEQRALMLGILSNLGEIKKRCDEMGRELWIVIIPNKIQVENAEELTNSIYAADKPNQVILEYCRDLGVRCVDLLPRLRVEQERNDRLLYFPVDRHFTELGNQVAVDEIYRNLAPPQNTVHGR